MEHNDKLDARFKKWVEDYERLVKDLAALRDLPAAQKHERVKLHGFDTVRAAFDAYLTGDPVLTGKN